MTGDFQADYRADTAAEPEAVLAARGVSVAYSGQRAVTDVSLAVRAGESLAIVGESGCGKSTLVRSLGGVLPNTATMTYTGLRIGETEFGTVPGDDTSAEMRASGVLGGVLGYVFQEPTSYLNPSLRISTQLREVLQRHFGMGRREAWERSVELLHDVGIADPQQRLRSYPHELSGGQAQRVAIAIAIAAEPEVLIADEPTSSLDVTVARRIVALLRRIQRERGMALIHVTHNLHLAARSADRVAVMYAGEFVELGPATTVLETPQMPYTKALLAAAPAATGSGGMSPIPGDLPDLSAIDDECRFYARCPRAEHACQAPIRMLAIGVGHEVRCQVVTRNLAEQGAARADS